MKDQTGSKVDLTEEMTVVAVAETEEVVVMTAEVAVVEEGNLAISRFEDVTIKYITGVDQFSNLQIFKFSNQINRIQILRNVITKKKQTQKDTERKNEGRYQAWCSPGFWIIRTEGAG